MMGLCAVTAGAAAPLLSPLAPGMGAEVDPGFAYYQNRSAAGIAAEVKLNGYSRAHYVATTDVGLRRDLIDAFHAERLPVWYLTFCHVAYSTEGFPPGWREWRMQLRDSPGDDFIRMCMNHPGYIAFKRRQIAETMRKYPFDGVELVEPFWPDAPGPESKTYGCLCPHCRAAFLKQHPEETAIPEFTDASSPRYYKTDKALYAKWVDFRVHSIGRFLNAVLADVRKERPNVPVLVWSLVQMGPNAVSLLREAQGNDAAAVAVDVKPSAICLQTNWMDWMRTDLKPDYVKGYQAYVDRLRAASPKTAFFMQVDTGSNEGSRQTYAWMKGADAASRAMGALGIVNYEYFITKSMYDDPPRLCRVKATPGALTLTFQKRVDAGRAADPANYRVSTAAGKAMRVAAAKTDGNIIRLSVPGVRSGRSYAVRIDEVRDTPEPVALQGLQGAHREGHSLARCSIGAKPIWSAAACRRFRSVHPSRKRRQAAALHIRMSGREVSRRKRMVPGLGRLRGAGASLPGRPAPRSWGGCVQRTPHPIACR